MEDREHNGASFYAFLNEGKLYAVDTPDNLKLRHGRRSIKVRVRENDGTMLTSKPP